MGTVRLEKIASGTSVHCVWSAVACMGNKCL